MIKTIVDYKTGKVKTEVCGTHYGHAQDLEHIRLPEDVRLSIAGQLHQGVSFQHILDNIRNSVGDDLKRIHLITRKDIRNTEKAYQVNSVRRHEDDATSVACWVQEITEKKAISPVIFYKCPGVSQPEDCDNMGINDFMICLQTPLQATLMKQFGHKKILCMDSTHGTNSYDFQLVTIVVVDEYGERYPVAWCLSNREDQFALENVLKPIRKRIGSITPAWFMSDDAEQYHNAWRSVFGEVDNKLLCTWHVDRAWRENSTLIKEKETKVAVYHSLRVLLEQSEVSKFNSLLMRTAQQLQVNRDTAEFGQYFVKTYMHRKRQWANCYRQKAFINTNMYVEAFHHVLKYIYLNGKVNKRVDKCIHTLLKITRDKTFERLIKMTKGKKTKKITEIHKRHLASHEMTMESVIAIQERIWEVKSSRNERKYMVALENLVSPEKCMLKCNECDICIHSFACTCQDYVVNGNMCKHIHLIVKFRTDKYINKTP